MKFKFQPFVFTIAASLFFSCPTYYLERYNGKLLNPNSSPQPVIKREKSELRLNAGLVGSINSHEASYSDDPFWGYLIHSGGSYSDNPYSSVNVHVKPVDIQGFLSVDKTFSKNIFTYFNGNMTYTERTLSGSGTLGIGYHALLTTSSNIVSNIGCQFFGFLGLSSLYSQADIMSQLSDNSEIITQSNPITYDAGVGFQFIRQAHHDYVPSIGIGLTLQDVALHFIHPNVTLPALLPSLSLLQKINYQNHVILSASYFLSREIRWPYIQLGWSYCVNNKKSKGTNSPHGSP